MIAWPVTKELRTSRKKAMAWAMSSGVPMRPAGIAASAALVRGDSGGLAST